MKQKRGFPEGSLRNLGCGYPCLATEPFGESKKNLFRQSLWGKNAMLCSAMVFAESFAEKEKTVSRINKSQRCCDEKWRA